MKDCWMMVGDLSLLVKDFTHKVLYLCTEVAVIGWQMIVRPKKKDWQIIEGNVGQLTVERPKEKSWQVVKENVSWRLLKELKAFNWLILTRTDDKT